MLFRTTSTLCAGRLFGVLLGACLAAACSGSAPRLHGEPFAQPRAAVDFTGTNWDGTPFRMSDHRGRVTVVFFGYTHCPDVCPVTFSKMKALYRQLGEHADDVAVVFVSVDPERDTVDKLAHYVPAFDGHFFGVRLDPEQLAATIRAYQVTAVKRYTKDGRGDTDRERYFVDHTGGFLVVDRNGMLRVRYSVDVRTEDMLPDLAYLTGEQMPVVRLAASVAAPAAGGGRSEPGASALVSVAGAVARPSHGGTDVSAVYLTIRNSSPEADRLLAVTTPAAREASLHETAGAGGVLRMLDREAFDIPAREAVRLAPGARHIMLMNLTRPLVTGDTIDLSLRFDRAGTIAVKVPVAEVEG